MTKNIFLVILTLFISCSSLIAQEKKLDSLAPITLQIKDSSNIRIAAELIRKLSTQENFDIALKYADQFSGIAEKINDPRGKGAILNEKGLLLNQTDKPYEALNTFDKAESFYEQAKYDKGIALVNNNKAVIEQKVGNPDKSITYLLKAKEYYQKLNDGSSLATTLTNIGNVYLEIKDFDKAKSYYFESLELKKKHKVNSVGETLYNLAHSLIEENKIDSARTVLNESLEYSKAERDSRSISEAYISLGKIYKLKKDYRNAQSHYESALFIGGGMQRRDRMIRTKLSLGEIAMLTGNLDLADMHIGFAREQAKQVKSVPLQLTAYEFSAQLDSIKENYQEAYKWQKKFQTLYADKAAKDKSEAITLAKKRLENERKRQQEEQKAKDDLLAQKIYTYIAIAGLILAIVFIFIFIKSRIERAKYTEKLDESNQVKNKLFSIISNDLKNEISGLDGMLNLFKDNQVSKDEFEGLIPILSNSSNKASFLLLNLFYWSKAEMKELKPIQNNFRVNGILNGKISAFNYSATEKGVEIINNVGNDVNAYADKDMIGMIAQNIISNGIKFCKKGDSITINHKEVDDDFIEISFTDTGIGMSEEVLTQLFTGQVFSHFDPNIQNTGTGLGLKICDELIEANGGRISVDSTEGEGSTFSITIPKAKA